jgi:hypothetical protein
MAGDWIPFTKDLAQKVEVLRIAELTGRNRREVACILMEFWAWADSQTEDGKLPGITVRNLSALHADTDETFWLALSAVGWLAIAENAVEIPNFDRWMGMSAKRRLRDSQRKRHKRNSCPQNVRNKSASKADKKRTTEQNRIEQNNNPPFPPSLDTERFRAAWDAWLLLRRKRNLSIRADTYQKHALARLAGWGEERALRALEYTTAQGYQGIVEPKESGHAGTQTGRRLGRVEPPAGKYDGLVQRIRLEDPAAGPGAGPPPSAAQAAPGGGHLPFPADSHSQCS